MAVAVHSGGHIGAGTACGAEEHAQTANRQCGFTLVEVMVAVVVLGIAMSSIMLMFSNAIKGIWGAGFRSQALQAAEVGMADKVAAGASSGADGLMITFPGMSEITVYGKTDTSSETVQGRTVTITAFMPRKK